MIDPVDEMPGIPPKPKTSPSQLYLPLVLSLVDLFDSLSAFLYSPTRAVRRRYVCVPRCLWRQRDPGLIYKDKNPLKWQPALDWALPSLPGACSPKMFIPDKQNTQPPSSPSPQRNAKHPAFSKYLHGGNLELTPWHPNADSYYPPSLAHGAKKR